MTTPIGGDTRANILAFVNQFIVTNNQKRITAVVANTLLNTILDSVLMSLDNLSDINDATAARANLGIPPSTPDAGGVVMFNTFLDLSFALGYKPGTFADVWLDPVFINNGIYQKTGPAGSGSWVRIGDLLGLPGSGGEFVFATLADINAALGYPANQKGEVWADPTPGNNGVYRKNGGIGTGSWTRIGDLFSSNLFYNVTTHSLETPDWKLGQPADSGSAFRVTTYGSYAVDITAPREAQTDFWTPEDIRRVNNEAHSLTNAMKDIKRAGLEVYGEGFNQVLAVGQSFMGGAVTNGKILTTTARNTALGVTYSASMLGTSERPIAANPGGYDYFGGGSPAPITNPLVATVQNDGVATLVDPTTAFNISVRGETPNPTACILFEYLWRWEDNMAGLDARKDVVTNVATTGSQLSTISSDPLTPLPTYPTYAALAADLSPLDQFVAQVWNDLGTHGAGVPNSGSYQKSGGTGVGSWTKVSAINGTSTPLVIYATYAALIADLVPVDGTIIQIWQDGGNHGAAVPNNGIYLKSGASGAGSWIRAFNTNVPYPRSIFLNTGVVFNAAVNGIDPTAKRRLTVVHENHGQADNSLQTPTATYMAAHRAFRADIFTNLAAAQYSQKLTPLWVGTQVAGRYSNANRFTAQAQLNMSLADNDYCSCMPDYGWTNFVTALPHPPDVHDAPRPGDHPYWLNRHPSTNAQRYRGTMMAIARFFIQVLHKNWFMTHMAKAYWRGSSILIPVRCMQGPLRIVPTLLGLNFLTYTPWMGLDVEDNGVVVPITSVTLPAGTDLTIRVDCGQMLGSVTPPIIGTGTNILGTLDGSTNIRDSFTLWSVFQYIFEHPYMDTLLTGPFDDPIVPAQENIASLLGTTDLGNWMAVQRVTCEPLPSTDNALGAT